MRLVMGGCRRSQGEDPLIIVRSGRLISTGGASFRDPRGSAPLIRDGTGAVPRAAWRDPHVGEGPRVDGGDARIWRGGAHACTWRPCTTRFRGGSGQRLRCRSRGGSDLLLLRCRSQVGSVPWRVVSCHGTHEIWPGFFTLLIICFTIFSCFINTKLMHAIR